MKTAKEKAKELVDKYYYLFLIKLENTIDYRSSKKCALIAVDNIILANPHSNPFNTDVYSTMKYWAEVRKEIENL